MSRVRQNCKAGVVCDRPLAPSPNDAEIAACLWGGQRVGTKLLSLEPPGSKQSQQSAGVPNEPDQRNHPKLPLSSQLKGSVNAILFL